MLYQARNDLPVRVYAVQYVQQRGAEVASALRMEPDDFFLQASEPDCSNESILQKVKVGDWFVRDSTKLSLMDHDVFKTKFHPVTIESRAHNMLKERSWTEFQQSGMLWFINRILHTFGWAVVIEGDNSTGNITVFPARCSFRGFDEESEERGYRRVTQFLKNHIDELVEDLDK